MSLRPWEFARPAVWTARRTLWPHLPGLLDRLDRLDAHAQGLAGLSGHSEGRTESRVQRSRGREFADWEGLRGWFRDTDGQGSQVDQLRDATLRALQSLLANAKRMLRSATGEMSRRRDLLRLARWFDQAAPQDAHDIAVAAFGLYGARHLGTPPATDEVVPAYTSWWTGPVVQVPVALRERGSRAQRGRTASVEDHSAQGWARPCQDSTRTWSRRWRATSTIWTPCGPNWGAWNVPTRHCAHSSPTTAATSPVSCAPRPGT
nr:DUF2397 domain-containing protein [Streptomyces sp. NBC_00857]